MRVANRKRQEFGGPLYWAAWVAIFTALYVITTWGAGTIAPNPDPARSEVYLANPGR